MTAADLEAALELTMALCVHFEAIKLSPYLCPAGVPTIGLGSTRYADGSAVRLTDPPISRDEALELARGWIRRRFIPETLELCPAIDRSSRLAAIADFAYNLGPGRLASSNLRRRINARRWDDVPQELGKWCFSRGRRLPGLVARRALEARLTQSDKVAAALVA